MDLSKTTSPEYWKDKWHKCPPATIYLILGIASILLSVLYRKTNLIKFLVSVFVVAVVYYFLAFLCVEAPVIAWILILIQLFIIGYSVFQNSDMLDDQSRVVVISR